ncbi:tetrahydroberberine oxidase-like [Malania oleifera]|uniref:tetrahydroberberine oxidase-like n=1 Tax=Malania oleifera TaxID=397392 RepID=UPI0025AE0C95|nr:tetrahydroberberine oxidase-like [Malania oleifera]
MKIPSFSLLISFIFLLLISSISWATSTRIHHENFLQCMYASGNSTSISKLIYTPINSTYKSVLQSSIQNLRFSTPTTPKPLLVVTPLHESHIQAAIFCAKKHRLQIRIRSGGHDFEGLSYVSEAPFAIVDLTNLRSVSVDVKSSTAWVQAGATIGELYYNIAGKSRTLGFPGGVYTTVGVGGQFSAGGWGVLLRKHGLAADNVIDARLIDVNGKILDRESMGEDLFWAIRGGGGASFGVILAWKLKLVQVPPTVTVFTVYRTLEQNATELVHRWQNVASKLHEDVFSRVSVGVVNSTGNDKKRSLRISFSFLYLGGATKLFQLMQESFPELGLLKEDCLEMSWIQSTLYAVGFPIEGPFEVLLNRTPYTREFFKSKSDYVREPISEIELEGLWEKFYHADGVEVPEMFMTAFGGRMSEISESEIPFPHRAGNIYQVQYKVGWKEEGRAASRRHVEWIRRLYSHMAPFVSKFPRAAYMNYRDLDLGSNGKGSASYGRASVWGLKYFKNNFNRLVHVKSVVDPGNFFMFEQSIPSLPAWRKKGD